MAIGRDIDRDRRGGTIKTEEDTSSPGQDSNHVMMELRPQASNGTDVGASAIVGQGAQQECE